MKDLQVNLRHHGRNEKHTRHLFCPIKNIDLAILFGTTPKDVVIPSESTYAEPIDEPTLSDEREKPDRE